MDRRFVFGIALVLCGNMVAAVSQILLKKAAAKKHTVWWRSYLDPLVAAAYLMFFSTTVFSVLALRYIPLSLNAALSASGQVFVPFLSHVFLRERIGRKKWLGILTIVVGIVIFSM